jgi:hypothetical protein
LQKENGFENCSLWKRNHFLHSFSSHFTQSRSRSRIKLLPKEEVIDFLISGFLTVHNDDNNTYLKRLFPKRTPVFSSGHCCQEASDAIGKEWKRSLYILVWALKSQSRRQGGEKIGIRGLNLGNFWNLVSEMSRKARCQWLPPIILVAQEAEIRRILVRSHPGQIVCENLSKKRSITKRGLVQWLKV